MLVQQLVDAIPEELGASNTIISPKDLDFAVSQFRSISDVQSPAKKVQVIADTVRLIAGTTNVYVHARSYDARWPPAPRLIELVGRITTAQEHGRPATDSRAREREGRITPLVLGDDVHCRLVQHGHHGQRRHVVGRARVHAHGVVQLGGGARAQLHAGDSSASTTRDRRSVAARCRAALTAR